MIESARPLTLLVTTYSVEFGESTHEIAQAENVAAVWHSLCLSE
jgi:hypothetical protein